jgi:hypothetical protein
LDVDGISHGSAISADAGPETQCKKNVAKLAIVSAVGRRIEAEQLRVPLFVDVEVGDQMVALQ